MSAVIATEENSVDRECLPPEHDEGVDDKRIGSIVDDDNCKSKSTIDTTTRYDVVICGTGLVQSILASSLALVGVNVLHCDCQDIYGEIDASYGLMDLISWAKQQQQQQQQQQKNDRVEERVKFTDTPLTSTATATGVHPKGGLALIRIHSYHQSWTEEEERQSRKFVIDLMPRVLFANGPAVSGLISSSVSTYIEFMTVQGLFLMTADTLQPVPSSKSQVFQSTLLSPIDKRKLMKFLHLVLEYGELTTTSSTAGDHQHYEATETSSPTKSLTDGGSTSIIDTINERNVQERGMSLRRPQNKPMNKSSIHHLLALTNSSSSTSAHLPLQEYIQAQFQIHSSSYLSKVILHALCLQYTSHRQISVTNGLNALVRHASSLGKYSDTALAATSTAFIAPLYGTTEIVQGFCRSCAVHGGVYMLRTTMNSILQSTTSSNDMMTVTGVMLSKGAQHDDSDLATGPSSDFPVSCQHVVVPHDALIQQSYYEEHTDGITTKILRRAIVIRGLLQLPSQQQRSIVIIPPLTEGISNREAIFALILDASLHICPLGYTIVHLSTAIATSCSSLDDDDEITNNSIQSLDKALHYLLNLCAANCSSSSSNTDTTANMEGEVPLSSQRPSEIILQVTFTIPVDDDDLTDTRGSTIYEVNQPVSGLHICKRPKLTITLDEAFEEAERIFNEIMNDQAAATTRQKFLMMSDEIRSQVRKNIFGIRNDDAEEDDEKDILASAMDLIAPTDQRGS